MINEFKARVVGKILTDFEVYQIARNLRDDLGSPAEARIMIEQFVAGCFTARGPSPEALMFVRDALGEFLDEGKSLESAFRFKKGRRGQPNAGEIKKRAMAEYLLVQRVVAGKSYEESVQLAVEVFSSSSRVVGRAFARHKMDAFHSLNRFVPPRVMIDVTDPPQIKRLVQIFPHLTVMRHASPSGSRV